MSDVKFEFDSREFLAAIRGIANFASHDDTLPMLTSVRFQVRPGWLYLSATDRYVLGQLRLPLETKSSSDFIVQRSELARMSRYFPPPRRERRALEFSVGDVLTIEEVGAFAGIPGVRATFALYTESSFPKMDSLWPAKIPTSAEPVAFNPDLARKFAAVQRFADPLRFVLNGQGAPGLVTMGDYFRGLIMPVKVPVDDTGDDWPLLDAVAQLPKAKAPRKAAPRKRAS